MKNELRDFVVELQLAAEQIRREGHNGWGNLCDDAAQEVLRLRAECARLERASGMKNGSL